MVVHNNGKDGTRPLLLWTLHEGWWDISTALLHAKADANAPGTVDDNKEPCPPALLTAVQKSAPPDLVKLLLEHKAATDLDLRPRCVVEMFVWIRFLLAFSLGMGGTCVGRREGHVDVEEVQQRRRLAEMGVWDSVSLSMARRKRRESRKFYYRTCSSDASLVFAATKKLLAVATISRPGESSAMQASCNAYNTARRAVLHALLEHGCDRDRAQFVEGVATTPLRLAVHVRVPVERSITPQSAR